MNIIFLDSYFGLNVKAQNPYRVSHKKVYPFEANLVIIEFESLAYLSHTIG